MTSGRVLRTIPPCITSGVSGLPPRSRTFGRRRLGAGVWAPPFGRTAVWAPDVWAPALMQEEIGFYRHYLSSIPFKLRDENDACFTAIEAGWTDINFDMYSSIKITRVSQQSKLDELISMMTRILR